MPTATGLRRGRPLKTPVRSRETVWAVPVDHNGALADHLLGLLELPRLNRSNDPSRDNGPLYNAAIKYHGDQINDRRVAAGDTINVGPGFMTTNIPIVGHKRVSIAGVGAWQDDIGS